MQDCGSFHVSYDGRFLGVRRGGANGVSREAPKAQSRENPSLDAVMNALKPLYKQV